MPLTNTHHSRSSLISITACLFLSSVLYQTKNTQTLLVSARKLQQEPKIFPEGAKSLFIGNSFFVPIAEQCSVYAKHLKMFRKHDFEYFRKAGSKGSPIYLWENHLDEIKELLQTGDKELFGMTFYPQNHDDDEVLVEDALPVDDWINAYKRWIDLAHSYNPDTSIFIGVPWIDHPTSYDTHTYMTKIQEGGDILYRNIIMPLREMYPTTDIYFLDYGGVAGEMRHLFDEDKLSDITTMIQDDSSNEQTTLYLDERGHPGKMLLQLVSLTWLSWLYTGDDFNVLAKKVHEYHNLGWNEENIIDIYQVAEQLNQDYRIYGVVDTKSTRLSTKKENTVEFLTKRRDEMKTIF